ncbi:putative phylloplanin [Helianthus debilis subsp. tardiflorus]
MAMKSITLIIALVVVLVATQAEAQLIPRIPVFNITGNVSCSVNGSIAVNSTNPLPPFPNALVQVLCNRIVRGVAITNRAGAFNIIFPSILINNQNIASSCRAVVATPLTTCNATLPSTGTLQAQLQVVSSIVVGLLNITTIRAGPFELTITSS